MIFLFEHRNFHGGGQVQYSFQSWDLCRSTVGSNTLARAPAVLKIHRHSSNSLQFFGTFILELYVEFLFATIMFIKFNANGQVRPRLDTIQKANSWIMMLNHWTTSSNKILDWFIVSWIYIVELIFLCVVCIKFSFNSLDFHSRRGLRHTVGIDSMSWPVQLVASRNENSSFEIKLWLVPDSIFMFIHHSLSPFDTNVFL
jgi:hypothetical protein